MVWPVGGPGAGAGRAKRGLAPSGESRMALEDYAAVASVSRARGANEDVLPPGRNEEVGIGDVDGMRASGR